MEQVAAVLGILIVVVLILGYFVLVIQASRGALRNQQLAGAVIALFYPLMIFIFSIGRHGWVLSILWIAAAVWYLIAYLIAWRREEGGQGNARRDERGNRQVVGVVIAQDRLVAGIGLALVVIGALISIVQIVGRT